MIRDGSIMNCEGRERETESDRERETGEEEMRTKKSRE
jgi:hypothetical protein